MPILQPHDTVHELGFSPLRDVHFSGIPLTLRVHFYGYSLLGHALPQLIQCKDHFLAAPLLGALFAPAVDGDMPGDFSKKSTQNVGFSWWDGVPRRQICIADAFLRVFAGGKNVVGDSIAIPAVFLVCFRDGLFRSFKEQVNNALILQGIT